MINLALIPMNELKLYQITFENNPSWGIFEYMPKTGSIQICYEERNEQRFKAIENEIEALLSHESIHGVLHKIENANTSWCYDQLGEYLGYTPFSYPQSSTGTTNLEEKE